MSADTPHSVNRTFKMGKFSAIINDSNNKVGIALEETYAWIEREEIDDVIKFLEFMKEAKV